VESVPGATTLLKFRHLLEKQALTQVIFEQINGHQAERGMLMREGTIVDATIIAIAAPPSTKNRAKARTDDANRSATKDLDLTITDVDTTPTAAINVSGDQAPDQDLTFNAVAIEGTTVLIGAYTSPTSAYLEPGKAYFYDVSDSVSP
jgi:hypothetical protein